MIGQSIGRYHIVEQLGEGGMATVYRAFDTRLERDVALKFIRRENFGSAQLEELLKRFEREAKSLAQLSHPNIVGVLDYGEHDGMPYLVMPFIPGGTLKKNLGRPLHWVDAIKILAPIAHALDYAHQRKMIHRDVKPANILISDLHQPMLSDFGIAKVLEGNNKGNTLTGTGVGVGTPEYMAPEQWSGEASYSSDVYALGVVLYELVTGRPPFIADTPMAILLKQIQDPLPSPSEFVPDLPQSIEQILYKALAKKSEDRYQTMAEFVMAMEKTLEQVRDQINFAEALPSKDIAQTTKTNRQTQSRVGQKSASVEREQHAQRETESFYKPQVPTETQRPVVKETPKRDGWLSLWNPIHWTVLLWWMFVTPSKLKSYREALNETGKVRLRQVESWLSISLIFLPLSVFGGILLFIGYFYLWWPTLFAAGGILLLMRYFLEGRIHNSYFLTAIFVILLSTWFEAQSLGFPMPSFFVGNLLPAFIVIGGLSSLMRYFSEGRTNSSHLFNATLAILLGAFFFMFLLSYWQWESMAQFWPLLLIIVGAAFFVQWLAEIRVTRRLIFALVVGGIGVFFLWLASVLFPLSP